jgi:phosphoglycerate dehydrogenase-like enzyme
LKILMASPRLARTASKLQEMIPKDIQIIIPKTESIEELANLARDVEVIICVHLSREVVQAAKRLKFIQKRGAGVDGIPFDVLKENILVANTSGANPVPLAEGIVALVLALAKRIVQRHNRFQERNMKHKSGVELRGKKVGIIGLGSIGIEVARLLHAFQMRILALKRNPSIIPETKFDFDFLGGPEDLKYLLKNSDFVIVTVPLTPETRGMIGEHELQLMRKTAYIINVARADIIQEKPLYKALKEDWIAGAAIDVWWPPHWWDPTWNIEEIRPEYPIWKLSNVIATPHNIGSTDTPSDAGLHIIADNIHRLIDGLPLINQVNKTLQY